MERIYVVTMHRWNNLENHTYVVATTNDLNKARKYGEDEADFRGGKYGWAIWEVKHNIYDSYEGSVMIERSRK